MSTVTIASLEDLKRFKLDCFLSEDPLSHTIALLGSLQGNVPAILRIERVQLDLSAVHSFSAMIDAIERIEMQQNTDIYTWMLAWLGKDRAADVKLYLIAPATDLHVQKYTTQRLTMVRETPELYRTIVKPYIDSLPLSRTQWVLDILSGKAEASSILHNTEDFVILPDMKWTPPPALVSEASDTPLNVSALYLVAIAREMSIRSLRDLRKCHIPILQDIQRSAARICLEKWGLSSGSLRCFIHYQPSYYHFHVHIVNANHVGYLSMAVGQAHLLDDVISLLDLEDPSVSAGTFERMTLTYGLGECHGLFEALVAQQQD